MSMKLTPDTPAPALKLPLVGGGSWDLAAQTPDGFTMVVFYRGLHCPLCKSYLSDLSRLQDDFIAAGVTPVAVSMDVEARAQKSVDDWGVANLSVAYGLSIADARAWGLWLSRSIREGEPDVFSEPGLYWVRPDGRIFLASVSNAPFARPDLDALLSKVAFVRENNYPARGTYAD